MVVDLKIVFFTDHFVPEISRTAAHITIVVRYGFSKAMM